MLMNFPDNFQPQKMSQPPAIGEDDLAERWILSRLQQTAKDTTAALDSFRLNDSAGSIYKFIWHDFCDWYIELSKDKLASTGPEAERTAWVLWYVLEASLRLLHPFMPFITEEIWQRLPHEGESLFLRPWVEPDESQTDRKAEKQMGFLQELIIAVRTIRSEMNVPPAKKATLAVIPADENVRGIIERYADFIRVLARVERIGFTNPEEKPTASGIAVIGKTELFVPLKGLIDLDREREKLRKEAERLRKMAAGIEKKLANENFLSRAPAEIVERERQKKESCLETLDRVESNMAQLSV